MIKMACRCGHQLRDHEWFEGDEKCEECHCKKYIKYETNDLDECPHCSAENSLLHMYKGIPFVWYCPDCKTIWIFEESGIDIFPIKEHEYLLEKKGD